MNEYRREFEPKNGITPLSADQRAEYQTVIYQHESTIASDRALVAATAAAMQEVGFKIAIDVDADRPQADHAAVIRSAAEDRKAQSAEGALFLGVTEATRRKLAETHQVGTTAYQEATQATARDMLQTVVGKPELLESFTEYYGGLRWGSDQEKFVRTLFEHGTDFDPEFVADNVRGGDLSSLVYELDVDISYDQRRDWHGTPIDKILKKHPELDYRRLEDESFRQSEEGQKLIRAYEHLQGDLLARRQKSHETVITTSGEALAEPAIPLSRHPVIEALIIDEMSLDRPKPKYSFGPSELAGIVLDSDSKPAHQALVDSITTRLPEGQRRVFDGPDEFQFKRVRVVDLIREYKRADNPERRTLLRDDMLQVMDAYTGDGAIAASVREDYQAQLAQGREERGARSEANQVNSIMTDMLTVAFAAPDPEITARAQDIVFRFLPEREGMVTIDNNPLTLDREQLGLALIDSLEFVGEDSNPQLFEQLGAHIFGDPAVGAQLRDFAQIKARIDAERNRPDILKAFDERRRHSRGHFSGEKTAEHIAAEQRYESLTRGVDELSESLRRQKREFFLTQAERIVDIQGQRDLTDGEAMMFTGLIKRTKLGEYHMRSLPAEYHRMMAMAKFGHLTERQQSTIAWQMYESFKYVDEEAAHMMVPVVLDIYEAALGPVDSVRFPSGETNHTLAAASQLVREHGSKMFQSASQEDLQTLATYADHIRDYAERIANHQFLPDGVLTAGQEAVAGRADWRKDAMRNLADVARKLQAIDKHYK